MRYTLPACCACAASGRTLNARVREVPQSRVTSLHPSFRQSSRGDASARIVGQSGIEPRSTGLHPSVRERSIAPSATVSVSRGVRLSFVCVPRRPRRDDLAVNRDVAKEALAKRGVGDGRRLGLKRLVRAGQPLGGAARDRPRSPAPGDRSTRPGAGIPRLRAGCHRRRSLRRAPATAPAPASQPRYRPAPTRPGPALPRRRADTGWRSRSRAHAPMRRPAPPRHAARAPTRRRRPGTRLRPPGRARGPRPRCRRPRAPARAHARRRPATAPASTERTAG